MVGVNLTHAQGCVAAFHDVAPTGAMHMQVDEARQYQGQARCACRVFTDDLALDAVDASLRCEGHGAVDEAGRSQDIADHVSHGSRLNSATKS